MGGAVTDILMQGRHEVRVYDALFYEEAYRKPVGFVYGDIRDHDKLKEQLRWADAVVWLAALVGDPVCALNPDVSIRINQAPVQWLAANYDGRIIFTSTCSVYGAREGVLDESSPTGPLSVYAVTKLQAEQYLADKNALIFRFGTLYGVGDLFSRIRLDLVVNTLTVRAYQLGQISVYGGEQYRPLLHVKDAAQAIVDTLEKKDTGTFNLHSENIKIADLADIMVSHFPKLAVERVPREFEDTRNYRVTSDRAVKTLGFRPALTINDGIVEIKELLESGRLKDPDNPRYTNQKFLAITNEHVRG